MAKLKTKFNNDTQLITVVAGMISGYPDDVQETFTRLIEDKYLDAADKVLYTRYGERDLRSDDSIIINMEILSYLILHAPYYKKCLAYIDAEYNPVENYSSVEHETIKNEIDEVNNHGTNTKAEDTFKHGAHTDQHIHPQYTDTNTEGQGGYDVTVHTAKVKTESTPGTDTSTLKTAPYESSSFHNKEETSVTHTMGTETVERVASGNDSGNDKTSFSQKTDTYQHGAHTEQDQFPEYSDINHVGDTEDSFTNITDEREDNTTRHLTRAGNIGVMTAAQMMKEDEEFWRGFGWLVDIAHDVANLLTVGVWTI